jgi:hypothetical protein
VVKVGLLEQFFRIVLSCRDNSPGSEAVSTVFGEKFGLGRI